MTIDFETPMTFYELVGIVLAALALIIPFIKWLYEKWFKRLKIDFLISDLITIYFNKSGSYINLGGVYKADNKTATVKNISAQVIRNCDNAMLNLTWSTFPSPLVKEIGGQYESSFETAHPFSAIADTLTPVFIEFAKEESNVCEEIDNIIKDLHGIEYNILNQPDITLDLAIQQIKSNQEYINTKISMYDYFFWKKGTYQVNITTKYDDTQFQKIYKFELTEEDLNKLQNNLENMLLVPIANHFNIRLSYYTIRKKIFE